MLSKWYQETTCVICGRHNIFLYSNVLQVTCRSSWWCDLYKMDEWCINWSLSKTWWWREEKLLTSKHFAFIYRSHFSKIGTNDFHILALTFSTKMYIPNNSPLSKKKRGTTTKVIMFKCLSRNVHCYKILKNMECKKGKRLAPFFFFLAGGKVHAENWKLYLWDFQSSNNIFETLNKDGPQCDQNPFLIWTQPINISHTHSARAPHFIYETNLTTYKYCPQLDYLRTSGVTPPIKRDHKRIRKKANRWTPHTNCVHAWAKSSGLRRVPVARRDDPRAEGLTNA